MFEPGQGNGGLLRVVHIELAGGISGEDRGDCQVEVERGEEAAQVFGRLIGMKLIQVGFAPSRGMRYLIIILIVNSQPPSELFETKCSYIGEIKIHDPF